MEFTLKYRQMRDLEAFMNQLLIWLDEVEQHLGVDYGRLVLNYVGNSVEFDKADLFIEMIENHLTGNLKGDAMTLAEAFAQKGREQAIQETKTLAEEFRREGIQQDRLIIARRLLAEGLSVEQIAKITELSQGKINKL